ncbi:MAG: amylo-alpha-1,6-glucosidase [Acidimicrobiales bacterium]
MEVQVGPPVLCVHDDDQFLVCEENGHVSSTTEQGFFVRDTRMVSGYRLKLGRAYPVLLNGCQVQSCSARIEFTNQAVETATGRITPNTLHLRVDRVIGDGLHEDYDLVNYGSDLVQILLEVSVESDFADLFDVRSRRRLQRGSIQATWDESEATLVNRYENGPFIRQITFCAKDAGSPTEFANGAFRWKIRLEPGHHWHTCLLWMVDVGEEVERRPVAPCSALTAGTTTRRTAHRKWADMTTRYETSDQEVNAALAQAVDDLATLRLHVHDESAGPLGDGRRGDEIEDDSWVPAAGVPWFVSLFGRDSLVVSLQTLSLSPRFALGTLRALARLQADAYDDERDMQPGKIEHEVRHGELAALHLVPHTPYYGTHDATTLYVWSAAEAWRWHGDRAVLDARRPHVERALDWIDRDGDQDGDGLQEYQTRASSGGYYNQGWKDSGDAIVDERGRPATLPIALCELQGYVVAAKRAWADILEQVYGETAQAQRRREEADRLASMIEELFWWEEEGTYYLGLDGSKRPIPTVASNPGHLLWAGAVDPERARRSARRLLAADMWSGWGIRTLSSQHPRYNPFSYQLGSVWPHDNVIAAAGFRRYGLDTEAAQVVKGVFDASARFRSSRLPELFAGIERDEGNFPVQYLGANVPQAWASGAVIHAIDVLMGFEADAQRRSLTLRPALPDWLPELRVSSLGVGSSRVSLVVRRGRDGSSTVEVSEAGGLSVQLGTTPPCSQSSLARSTTSGTS